MVEEKSPRKKPKIDDDYSQFEEKVPEDITALGGKKKFLSL
jgi:hypothetical protein